MNFCGIDPGVSGGVALLDATGEVITVAQASEELETCKLLRQITDGQVKVLVEKVSGFIGEAHPGSAMFNFGRNVGVTVGCLLTLGAAFEEVEPQRWQSALGLKRRRGVAKNEWKRQLKARAQELWPKYRVTLWAADCMLIARFGWLSSIGASSPVAPYEGWYD